MLRGFSARCQAIEAHLANLGADSPSAAQIAALVTRTPKLPSAADGSDEGLRARWRARSHELGLDPASVDQLLGRHEREALTEARRHALVVHLLGEDGLTASDSVFERRDAVRGIAELLADGASAEEIEAVADLALGAHGVVALTSVGRGAEQRHTTEELLSVESQAIECTLERRSDRVGVVEPPLLAQALARGTGRIRAGNRCTPRVIRAAQVFARHSVPGRCARSVSHRAPGAFSDIPS